MANRTSVYKEILKQYDELQLRAVANKRRKTLEIYNNVPRIEEIDTELSMVGIELTKVVLTEPTKVGEAIEILKEKQKILNEEKHNLLTTNGYNESSMLMEYECQLCKDTGYIENERCSCFTQKLVDMVYNKSNLKEILKDENFSKFNMEYYSNSVLESQIFSPREMMQKNLSICLSFVNGFKKKKENLFLYGKTGLGKTFICNSIAKELLDRGITVMYVTAPQLFMEIEKERFNKNIDESEEMGSYIDDALTVELLIIDDLGSEFDTAFTSSQLFNIINTRVTNSLATIISTNLDMSSLSEKYSDRITSRLLGDFTTLKFTGEDIRSTKKFEKE